MHLIAFALAHLEGDVSPDFTRMVMQSQSNDVVDQLLGYRPVGIARALDRLPDKVLAAEGYRRLGSLLNDPATAQLLHHRRSINELMITGLHSLPPELRTKAILGMFNHVEGMHHFVEGLHCLANRAGLSFDFLLCELAPLNQAGQVIAKIKAIVENLPLLSPEPPSQVGKFRRIDDLSELRKLAKEWQNCLAGYLFNVSEATCAVYCSDPPDQPVASLIYRQWRLGWFLEEPKGPRNSDLSPDLRLETYRAFSEAGIFRSSIIQAIKNLVLTHPTCGF